MASVKWLPKANFVTLHYAYIIFMSILGLVVLYPLGNMAAVDAYFFGASASTESGLNTVDVKDLMTYQQLYLYLIPMFTNLGFINAVVVLVRYLWFRKHLQSTAPRLLRSRRAQFLAEVGDPDAEEADVHAAREKKSVGNSTEHGADGEKSAAKSTSEREPHITFDDSVDAHPRDATLYIPGPREREHGQPIIEARGTQSRPESTHSKYRNNISNSNGEARRRRGPPLSEASTMERVTTVTSSLFVMGGDPLSVRRRPRRPSDGKRKAGEDARDMLALSRRATLGRNSDFRNLTSEDREKLGGMEYRSLRLLLKITFGYFFGLHLLGAVCLVGWIQHANPKYAAYLDECGQDKNWWAFYSAQTMVDNLGFTLTPDSMISFRDAGWPMFIMSFLAFAGNTLYPVLLRLVVWTLWKLAPARSAIREPLAFLLDHPRRCYTLLFPSRPTWILFGIVFALNFIDILLIIVLDLDNPEVAVLPAGPRVLAAIFQAASSRHTGTSTFNLAAVSPAVQFSLMVMMYIAIFPIAISIRTSNIYEERSLGVYDQQDSPDEHNGSAYLSTHVRNQLGFDLWYIFIGIFCICVAESAKIVDLNEPAFSVWSVFFEVTSAYGNVGLSLGHPSVATSLSGKFNTFSKLVICAVMIRGRHRGLPYALDRAIMLPDEHVLPDDEDEAD